MQNLNDIKIGTLNTDGTVSKVQGIKFNTLYESDSSTILIADSVIDTGECNHRLVVEIMNLKEFTGEEEYEEKPYVCTISSVIDIDSLTEEQKNTIAKSMCVGVDEINACDVHQYGLSVPLEESDVQANDDFTAWIEETSSRVSMLYGFYMDRPVNRIGTTGWDFIQGNIMEGLK